MKNERNALNATNVKLGRPNTTACVVKTRSETVWSALLDNTPRGRGTVEVAVDTSLLRGGGVVASRQCMQRHLIRSLQVDRLWKTEGQQLTVRLGARDLPRMSISPSSGHFSPVEIKVFMAGEQTRDYVPDVTQLS